MEGDGGGGKKQGVTARRGNREDVGWEGERTRKGGGGRGQGQWRKKSREKARAKIGGGPRAGLRHVTDKARRRRQRHLQRQRPRQGHWRGQRLALLARRMATGRQRAQSADGAPAGRQGEGGAPPSPPTGVATQPASRQAEPRMRRPARKARARGQGGGRGGRGGRRAVRGERRGGEAPLCRRKNILKFGTLIYLWVLGVVTRQKSVASCIPSHGAGVGMSSRVGGVG